jgi:hypothetical protein
MTMHRTYTRSSENSFLNIYRRLSAGALDALKQFYSERDSRHKAFEDLKAQAESDFDTKQPLSMSAFTEDWNASQFWYDDATASTLAEQLLDGAIAHSKIAVVSAPSVFLQLKNQLTSKPECGRPDIRLLEYDERFGVFKEFVTYDFEQPTRLPPELKGSFDHIICDPPFLSEDCQTKAALTVRWLANSWSKDSLRLIVCTGERMESLIHKLYAKVGIQTTDFEVKHSKGLSNEFRCYSNFENETWKFSTS